MESDEVGSLVHPDLRTVVTQVAPIPQAKRTPTIPYVRKKRVAGVTATRKSARSKGAAGATPVLEKAQRRASEKNLETVININKAQGNDYTLLDSLPDSHLELVATDNCVIFNPRVGAKEEALSLIRAKELAQATLAEAADALLQEQAAEVVAAREVAAAAPTTVAVDADGGDQGGRRGGSDPPRPGPGPGGGWSGGHVCAAR